MKPSHPATHLGEPPETAGRSSTDDRSDSAASLHRHAFLAALVVGKRTLDLDCGDGDRSAVLAASAERVTGVDPDRSAIERAKHEHGEHANLEFVAASSEALPFDTASFDAVVSAGALECCSDPAAVLTELARVLKPSGILIASTPHEGRHVLRRARGGLLAEQFAEERFRALLAGHFAHVQLAAQQLPGIVALPASNRAASHHFDDDGEATDDDTLPADAHDDPRCSFAIASASPIAPLPSPQLPVADVASPFVVAPPDEAETPDSGATPARTDSTHRPRRLIEVGKLAVRRLGLTKNPRTATGGPSNSMLPLPQRIAVAAARAASRAALWVHRLRPSVAHSILVTRGLFDATFYRRRYQDVADFGDTLCAIHYAVHGWREGRRPGRLFDPEFYLREYPDVRAADMNPLLHYALHGSGEWRAPNAELRSHSKLLIDGNWVCSPDGDARDGPEAEVDPALRGVDHWAHFDAFREYIASRRRDARRAWAPIAPPMLRIAPTDLDKARARIDATLRPRATPRVSIVIPVHDELTVTLECLLSIGTHTTDAYEVVVVDDASSATTARCLAELRGIRYVRNEKQRGFGPTCNRGVNEARGEFVVLLNSDTQVSAGWLEPLIARLGDPSVAMVGPKLLFPQGALQEAGGRLRFDGSGDMVGVFEDPRAPRFSWARVVDYASAACVALRRADFEKLGGFDDRYAPAYCEDADLCLRLQADGRRIVYEPRSTVLHHLSKTTRASSQLEKVARVQQNQLVLYERFAEQLAARDRVRLMAFYLPQFHAIPENDRWWGEGFTEWRNVAKARPRFRGHRQPRQPADLGYYDLRTPGVLQRQAALAQRYGVHGFTFYYYRLGGRRILETPLEQVRKDPTWTMPFALCWANENWTRRWDGQAKHILLAQEYDEAEELALIEDFLGYFAHPAYVRVNGAPLLLIYAPQALPDSRRTIDRWRAICRQRGVGEIYVVAVESHDLMRNAWDPTARGFDASAEFPPHECGQPLDVPAGARAKDYTGVVHDYRRVVEALCTREMPAYKRFRTVMPGWDNTARRKDDSHVFVNSGPAEYQTWLEFAIEDTRSYFVGDERLVFVNAWNEWAEAAYLEPDTAFGHAYLEATRNALTAERLRG